MWPDLSTVPPGLAWVLDRIVEAVGLVWLGMLVASLKNKQGKSK